MWVFTVLKIPFCLFYFWVALAVYNRYPSAYQALRNLKILQLPHSKTLKQVIKDGSEKDGIDDEYLYSQHKTYVRYQKEREEEGHPQTIRSGSHDVGWSQSENINLHSVSRLIKVPYLHSKTNTCKPDRVRNGTTIVFFWQNQFHTYCQS